MDAFFQWLTSNPIAEFFLIAVLGIVILFFIFISLVAFFQGREISIYPLKIGKLPNNEIDRRRATKRSRSSQEIEQNTKTRNFEGVWSSSYSPSDSNRTHDHVLKLQQSGNRISAISLEGSASSHSFKLSGIVRFDIYFSGSWESSEPGSIHHGVFQFIIDRKGKNMLGKWLGLKGTDSINSGDWILKKKD